MRVVEEGVTERSFGLPQGVLHSVAHIRTPISDGVCESGVRNATRENLSKGRGDARLLVLDAKARPSPTLVGNGRP